jgi:hypothetical protein
VVLPDIVVVPAELSVKYAILEATGDPNWLSSTTNPVLGEKPKVGKNVTQSEPFQTLPLVTVTHDDPFHTLGVETLVQAEPFQTLSVI